ncbi:MAG: helix-turn-helix domain-containing protein [Prevotellaceae bacterium]|jgi:transcriptional regulator with XRE-family HTH domain|nr:helix-turn-helix domain-containing protein [Prevotellaceae bacterium]
MKNTHIGETIKQKMKEQNFRVADFAKAIHCNRNNVYSIFKRKNIDVELLMLISKVLEYDFITEVYFKQKSTKKYLILLEVDEQQLQNFISDTSMKIIKQM